MNFNSFNFGKGNFKVNQHLGDINSGQMTAKHLRLTQNVQVI